MDEKELHSLLFSAIQHHNDSLLDDLLDGETGKRLLDSPGNEGNMLLHAAVIDNDLNCVRRLLEKGANPNVFDTIRSRTPLHLAVELNQTEMVKAFLELEHINLDLRDDRNLTCYEIAQFCDNQHLANLIKNRQDDIEQLKNDFYSVMNQACSSNEPKLVRELLTTYEKKFIDKFPKNWSPTKDRRIFALCRIKDLINWSSSSWNDVTLLFKSASKGHTEICRILIEYGATAKCNENTNYSPLYVAAYGGYTETVKLLLDSFPSLVREITIEKWTVLHACCLQGHSETAKLILNYPYSKELKHRYVSRSGIYEYHFAFDLNAQDAAGQTAIYLSVTANNEKLLDTLLRFSVEAKLLDVSNQQQQQQQHQQTRNRRDAAQKSFTNHSNTRQVRIVADKSSPTAGPTVAKTSEQLEKIIRQLQKLDSSSETDPVKSDPKTISDERKYLICPFEMDTYCDYNSKTALHLAVCQQYHSIATTLLVNGSNPNLPILSRDTIKSDFTNSSTDTGLNWLRSSKSTCLKEACRLNDATMCEILIRYGASDNQDNLALKVAAANKNNFLISKFLSLKSNVDPEYKINKKCNVEFASRYKQSQKLSKSAYGNVTTTFSSMFPASPVMIDWQNLKCLKQLDPQWLIDASLIHNKRLKHATTSLIAITRLDLSSNNLKQVHPVIFRLPSLRELNLSNNRLECLMDFNQRGSIEGTNASTTKLIESHRTAMKRSKSSNLSSIGLESSNIIDLNEPQEWDLPCLETLDLHDNRLISLPDCLFELPRLTELDVSSNQIRQLPCSMWTAPSLKEMIASGNLLDDLPRLPQQKYCTSPNLRLGLNDSPDEKNSLNSQHSVSLDKGDSSFISSTGSDCGNQKNQSCLSNLGPSEVSTIQLDSVEMPVEHLNCWQKKVELVSNVQATTEASYSDENVYEQEEKGGVSRIAYLNLSYNSFSSIPPVLVCLATELTRLNLSHNRLATLGSVNNYPAKLKNLDLSNNQISSWFFTETNQPDIFECCALPQSRSDSKFLYSGYPGTCPHKLETRLESLKSINLSHNLLKNIQLTLDPNLDLNMEHKLAAREGNNSFAQIRDQLIYPNVTALDISFNKIQTVPKSISELKDLSVLNLSGNVSITSLPSELGLASKLWNLGINGCSLGEPLKSIIESKTYKTMDIIGYLRSILEEAKPYARMKLMLVGLQGIGKTSLLEQMRLEGSSGSRRKAPEHWTKRMGHTSKSNIRNQRGVTLSTVGVDIHDWVFCKRTPRGQQNFGPVSFSTWDFGGQQEFYATHRYFLSKRSVYLVVWRLTDGISGILGIQQWLVNIQSRASGSPVIIVGTHEDLMEGGESGDRVRYLQSEVHRRFLNVSDHDKCGLPRVIDSIVVSTKTKLNIRNLCNRIYDVVFSLKCPGSNERLLEQKIPATYLYLEEIINWIVHDRQQKRKEPVLSYIEYRRITSEQLKLKYNKIFRDLEPLNSREINYNSELQQATRFLHENGILLHYEDANLRDLYFLDPQWLCDILSHVVTIREINPHVKNGLMKISDLAFLFKSIDVNLSGGIQSYVVNLLNKFEVALTWNSQYLLIPSLLPSSPNEITSDLQQDFQLKVAPKVRGRSAVRRYDPNRAAMRSTSIDPLRTNEAHTTTPAGSFSVEPQPDETIHRLVLLRYLPAGFLSRLQSDILSDPIFDDVCADLYTNFLENSANNVGGLGELVGSKAGWTCWRNGISLALQNESTINCTGKYENVVKLLNIQEIDTMTGDSNLIREKFTVECSQASAIRDSQIEASGGGEKSANKWCNLDVLQYSNIIHVSVTSWKLRVIGETGSVEFIRSEQQNTAKLLASAVDHIDNLLEDWYPSLGTRFAHTLGGNYLVTRVVPCTNCFSSALDVDKSSSKRVSRFDSRHSRANFTIKSARDAQKIGDISSIDEGDREIHCYYVEHCISNAYNLIYSQPNETTIRKFSSSSLNTSGGGAQRRSSIRNLKCPKHGSIALNAVAPDIVFDDISNCYKIDTDQVERCKLIGRGTFGFVFKGSIRSSFPMDQLSHGNQEVALKLLQPVDPGPEADQADISAYKSAMSNWNREPYQYACKSYCTARREVNILQALRHPSIVLFIGLCLRPLAIVLELATLGSLTDIFKQYKRAGMRIDQYSVQKTILQISKALEFMHQQKVIYRDLKAENVLVWSFPSPFATQLQAATVELKLADYGISRQALSTGIWKGFAGTINFLAPEILRHNGDEEYTEKVDCFSFGMFMFELLTLRPPFKHNEGTKNHLADGGRPTLTMRDLIYPNYIIDLMSICWSQEPHHRPTASQIVSIVSAPEFMQLLDVVKLRSHSTEVSLCGAIQYSENNVCSVDLWLGRQVGNLEVVSSNQNHWTQYLNLTADEDNAQLSCMCVVENTIWMCDADMTIHVIPLQARLNHQREYKSPVGVEQKIQDEKNENQIRSFSLFLPDLDTSIKQMLFVKSNHSVVLLLNNGQIWICRLDTLSCSQLDDGSIEFQCIALQEDSTTGDTSSAQESLGDNQDLVFNLYCGQLNGISLLEIKDDVITRQSILPLANKSVDLNGERITDSSQPTEIAFIAATKQLLWTAAGCTVHLWNLKDKGVVRKLDCWKLVPCSESLESINIESYYQRARSSEVTSLVYLNNQLFVGTSHGCFMVVEADSLKPMIVFRPYENKITILKPTVVKENADNENANYLVTIGSGFRDLMRRYVSSMNDLITNQNTDNVAILWSASYYNL